GKAPAYAPRDARKSKNKNSKKRNGGSRSNKAKTHS
ncbi:hypothetical protein EVA_21690, partial [gut metagenome]